MKGLRLRIRGEGWSTPRGVARLAGGGLLILLLALAAYSQSGYWASQAVLTALVLVAVTRGYAATGFVGWRVGVPLFSLLFITVIPTLEELAGLEEHSKSALGAEALLFLAAGIGAFVVTSSAAARGKPEGAPPPRRLPPALAWLLLGIGGWGIGYTLLFGYYGGTDLARMGLLSGIANAASTFFSAGLAVAWTNGLTGRGRRWLQVGLLGTGLHALVGLLSASKGAALFPLLVPLLCYVNVKASVPWRPVAVVMAAYVLVVFPFTTYWRGELGAEGFSRGAFARQGVELLLSGAWFGDADLRDRALRSGSRGLASVYGTILKETGVSASYEGGTTYLIALGVMVPRLLWPDKPDLSVANLVGKKYGIISTSDDATGIAPTWAGEAAMNFGPWGIPVLFALLGLLASWVDGPLSRIAGPWFAAWFAPVAIFGQEGLVAGTLLPGLRNALVALLLVALAHRLAAAGQTAPNSGDRPAGARGLVP